MQFNKWMWIFEMPSLCVHLDYFHMTPASVTPSSVITWTSLSTSTWTLSTCTGTRKASTDSAYIVSFNYSSAGLTMFGCTIDVWIWIEYHCTLALHFWLYLLLSDKHPENTQCSHKHPEACAGTALHMCSIILWSWYSKGNVAEWPLMGGNSTDPYMETCAFQTRAL